MTRMVMGLTFPNPLGLAAGFDRSGEQIAALAGLGFGHIEIGTITPDVPLRLDRPDNSCRLGINIGSSKQGLDSSVIEDYVRALRMAYRSADYLCANLSSPFAGRDANSDGVDRLIGRLKREAEICAKVSGRTIPILLKVEGGPEGLQVPAAIAAARHYCLDGLVLVSESRRRIAKLCQCLDGLTIVSVGGIDSAEEIKERLSAGASLVQIHSFFERHGAAGLRSMLEHLAAL